mmetsp:Transcript_57868/g.117686  ORF Transcript_57868/g.117686 Transcript_57868/m.117686 type:complete len:372 (+) Transcript_57868:1248-2363(+)
MDRLTLSLLFPLLCVIRELPPDAPRRVEFIPIMWSEHLHDQIDEDQARITIQEIPQLRCVTNEIVVDVLAYMSSTYCRNILEFVTQKITSICKFYQDRFPDFKEGGKCSLIGHSLGSIICWDLLSLKENESGRWGPELDRPIECAIPFVPEFTMLLGSPIGTFLNHRMARADFDAIRDNHPTNPEISPFVLPTKALYNIFNASDPVATRIEPLLYPTSTKKERIANPQIVTRLDSGVQRHTRIFGDFGGEVDFISPKSKADDIAEGRFTEIGFESDDDADYITPSKTEAVPFDDHRADTVIPLGGISDRVDFKLPPNRFTISQYFDAFSAHTSYFQNDDVINFIKDVSGQEEVIAVSAEGDWIDVTIISSV